MRILHATESFGGGVAAVIADYIAATPEHDHQVWMCAGRADDSIGDVLPSGTVIHHGPDGHAARCRHLAATARTSGAAVVHAHSSFAGVYARASRTGVPVVYTPHCFAFERPGRSSMAFAGLERILARRTAAVAACSAREAALAAKLGIPATWVPNIAPADVAAVAAARAARSGPLRVLTVGRVCPQKDPSWIAEAAARAGAGTEVDWRWVGGGDPQLTAQLRQAGVVVTGWMDRSGVLDELVDADLVVHGGAWEGFPVVLLEAAAAGVPFAARAIPAVADDAIPASLLAADPAAAAATVTACNVRRDRLAELAADLADVLAVHDALEQAAALRRVYTDAVRATPASR